MSKNKNLAYAVGGFLALIYIGWAFFGQPPSRTEMIEPPAPPVGISSTATTPAGLPPGAIGTPAAGLAVEPPADTQWRSYALSEAEITGLPPDSAPGTPLELWVTWEPPITKRVKLQRLMRDVVLERIIAGVTPEAPSTILLSVKADAVPDLLWADRFGVLSAIVAQ